MTTCSIIGRLMSEKSSLTLFFCSFGDTDLVPRGVVSGTHRCRQLPFNPKLQKKKKYKKAREGNRSSHGTITNEFIAYCTP